jgi:hypothetical protein
MSIKKIQVTDSNGNIYYLETDATIVNLSSLKILSTNVKDALEELADKKVTKKCTWNDLKGV